MLTPQEVADHAFAKASFGGYNMAMVDEFLDLLTADYTTLYKENAALKAKMKTLTDKLKEYRTTEDAMRKALVTAQKMADEMISEAEQKKTAILSAAKKQATGAIASLQQDTAHEQARLAAAQNATSAYLSKLKELCRHEMEYLASLSQLSPPAPAEEPIDPVEQVADDAAAAVEKRMERELPPERSQASPGPEAGPESLYQEVLRTPGLRLVQEPVQKRESEPGTFFQAGGERDDTEPTRRMNFNHLQTGKDYTIE